MSELPPTTESPSDRRWGALLAVGPLAAALLGVACGPVESAFDDPWTSVGDLREPPRPGEDQMLVFDGMGQYATLGTAGFPFGRAPQSIALWVKPARLDGTQSFVVLRKDFESGVQFGIRDGLLTAWRVYGGRAYVTADEPLAVDTWQHVAYVFDGTDHRLFVDGVERAVGQLEPNNRTSTSGWIGTRDGKSDFYAGALDRIRIWTSAQTAAQIEADRAGAAPDPAGLAVELSFDEDDELIAYDRSGRGNDAILGDGVTRWAPERRASDRPVP